MLFHTHQQVEGPAVQLVGVQGAPQRSRPLIPEVCFRSSHKKGKGTGAEPGEGAGLGEDLTTPHLEPDGTSWLISCSQCCVRVHTSCYGVPEGAEPGTWQCARCEANAQTQDCCLCPLRGGALQRANNDKWVHVLCAITVLEACFVSVLERGPVDLRGIPLSRFKLKCQVCRQRGGRQMTGCCVQCSHGRCSTAFHPSCAQEAGVLMYPDDWPFIVFISCQRHRAQPRPKRDRSSLRPVQVQQLVICKHKNGRYYRCEVLEVNTTSFYQVTFTDGSFSNDLLPEDIESRDCARLGPPAAGEDVQVRWTDGLLYGATFVAAHTIPMYQVEFEDGSQLSVKREHLYSLDEDLPKSVKSKLSVASDMRFDGIFTEDDVKQDTKRQRVFNSRYREAYVEPVIYRAILE